jgi:hypothetical protein
MYEENPIEFSCPGGAQKGRHLTHDNRDTRRDYVAVASSLRLRWHAGALEVARYVEE